MDHMTRLDPIGKLWSDSWKTYKRALAVAVQILAIPAVLLMMARASLSPLWIFLASLVLGFGTIAVIVAIGKGKAPLDAYKEAAKLFFPILWVGLLNCLAAMGGFVMLIIPGILMITWFVFSNYIVVMEGKRGLMVLQEGREYARGYWWAIFGRYLLIGLLTGLLVAVISGIATVLLGNYIAAVVYGALVLFVVPFTVAYSYTLYENIKSIKGDVSAAAGAHRGFLFASVLVGIAAPIVILLGFIVGAAVGIKREQMSAPNGAAVIPQSQTVPPSSAGGPSPVY